MTVSWTIDGEQATGMTAASPVLERGSEITIQFAFEESESAAFDAIKQRIEYANKSIRTGTDYRGVPWFQERLPRRAPVDSQVVLVEPGADVHDVGGFWAVITGGQDTTTVAGSPVLRTLELDMVVLADAVEYANTLEIKADFEKDSWALEFGGLDSGDYIETPNHSSLDITGDITIAFTAIIPTDVDVNADNNYRSVLTDSGATADSYGVLVEEPGFINFDLQKGGSREDSRGGDVPMDGTVFTVVCTHDVDTGESNTYVNAGTPYTETVATGPIDTNSDPKHISTTSGAHQFLGTLDRIRIDAREWSADEVAKYDVGRAVDDRARRLEYNLEEGSGDTAVDTAKSNDGTINGTSWVKLSEQT